jgi:hypothetical protein
MSAAHGEENYSSRQIGVPGKPAGARTAPDGARHDAQRINNA